jgi:hypothetical protein
VGTETVTIRVDLFLLLLDWMNDTGDKYQAELAARGQWDVRNFRGDVATAEIEGYLAHRGWRR